MELAGFFAVVNQLLVGWLAVQVEVRLGVRRDLARQQEQAHLPELQMGSVGRNMNYLVALPWIVPLPISVDLSERDDDFFVHIVLFRLKAMCFLGKRLDR